MRRRGAKSPTTAKVQQSYKFSKKIMKSEFYKSDLSKKSDDDYFVFLQEKIKNVSKPPKNPEKDIKIDETEKLTNLNVSLNQVRNWMKSFKSNAEDLHSITGSMMKHLGGNDEYVKIFTEMLNSIYREGFIPFCLRRDYIFGLYKETLRISYDRSGVKLELNPV